MTKPVPETSDDRPTLLEKQAGGDVWFVPHNYRADFIRRTDPDKSYAGLICHITPATAEQIVRNIHPDWKGPTGGSG